MTTINEINATVLKTVIANVRYDLSSVFAEDIMRIITTADIRDVCGTLHGTETTTTHALYVMGLIRAELMKHGYAGLINWCDLAHAVTKTARAMDYHDEEGEEV